MPHPSTLLHLTRGQTDCLHLQRGSVLSVCAGQAQLSQRVVLEHEVLNASMTLRSSAVFLVAISGDYQLAANADSALRVVRPAPLLDLRALYAWVPSLSAFNWRSRPSSTA